MPRRPELVEDLTKFSELGEVPETCRIFSPLYFLFVLVMSLLVTVLLVPALPFVVPFMIWRAIAYSGAQYIRQPKDVRVAIIGGGWSGVQAAARFGEFGITPTCYERGDGLGGTWHKGLKYHGVQIHGAMWITTFGDKNGVVPYSANEDENDGKVIGEEMCNYVNRFANQKDVPGLYKLNSSVKTVKMDSKSVTGTLVIEDSVTGETREEGPFDLIVYASMAVATPCPKLKGADQFLGKQYHTCDWKTEDFDDAVKNNKKVVVVGGSKAACDQMLNFHRAGYTNVTWVYRKSYLFWKYEVTFHDRSFFSILRGISTVMGMLVAVVSPALAGLFFHANGNCCTFDEESNFNDWSKFHFGILCPRQRSELAAIALEQRKPGTEPAEFTSKSLKLKNGEEIEADVVIWAVGNSTGIDKLVLEKDGKPFKLDDHSRLFNHFIVPRFPVLASATCLFTTFGPLRAFTSAELATYHLCVRSPLTEDYMESSANSMWSKNSPTKTFIWSSDAAVLRQFLLLHMDLMIRGIEPVHAFFIHSLVTFGFGRQKPLHFNLLPKEAYLHLAGPTSMNPAAVELNERTTSRVL